MGLNDRQGPHWTGAMIHAKDFAAWMPEFWNRICTAFWSMGAGAQGRLFRAMPDAMTGIVVVQHGMKGTPRAVFIERKIGVNVELIEVDTTSVRLVSDIITPVNFMVVP